MGAKKGKGGGNAKKGAKIFKTKCSACHTVDEGDPHKQGPNLHGVFGRDAGKAAGYSFSSANKKSGVVWGDESISKFIENPKKYMKGTKMVFAGMKKPQDRMDLCAYLKKATA